MNKSLFHVLSFCIAVSLSASCPPENQKKLDRVDFNHRTKMLLWNPEPISSIYAVLDQQEIGYVDYVVSKDGSGIDELYVAPEFRQYGLGGRLLQQALANIRGKNCTGTIAIKACPIRDWMNNRQGKKELLVAFYERYGARVVESRSLSVDMEFPAQQDHDAASSK
jgi:GNAT superfamily N-acetyltransferase